MFSTYTMVLSATAFILGTKVHHGHTMKRSDLLPEGFLLCYIVSPPQTFRIHSACFFSTRLSELDYNRCKVMNMEMCVCFRQEVHRCGIVLTFTERGPLMGVALQACFSDVLCQVKAVLHRVKGQLSSLPLSLPNSTHMHFPASQVCLWRQGCVCCWDTWMWHCQGIRG